ncbi:MAG: hypothetical protein U0269_07745 [Polyangiales bacterium]
MSRAPHESKSIEPVADESDHADDVDRRAILSRRAKLLSLALAGVAFAAIAPSENPVCAQHNVPGGAPVRMRLRARPDAGAADSSEPRDAALEADTASEALPEVESLPEETIDASVLVSPRPHVCLSQIIHDEPAPGCGCRRTGSSS